MSERQLDEPDDDRSAADPTSPAPTTPAPRPSSSSPSSPPGSVRSDDPDRMVAELTERARVRAAAVTAETAALVDAVAALRPFEGRLGVTWRTWVAWQLGLTTAEARRICCLAEKLPTLPTIDAAFRSGELSEGVTEVLARVATPANEAEVVAVAAKVATGAQLQQIARDYRQVRDTEAGRRAGAPDPADKPSEASWSWDHQGRFRGSWNLRPDDGATLEAALEAAFAHLRPTEADIDQGRVLGGDAAVAEGELRPGERMAARHRDALVAMAESALVADADDGLLPESTQIIIHRNIGPRGTVAADGQVHLPDLGRRSTAAAQDEAEVAATTGSRDDLDEVTDALGLHAVPGVHDPEPAARDRAPELSDATYSLAGSTIPGCGTIPEWLAAELACGSLCVTVEMIAGFPVSEPTAVRTFNRSQRRALRARDRHCRFPGCTRTRHLHAHHTKPWHPNRRTTVADAVLLCTQHHGLVHRKGYTISLGVDFVTTVTRPDGSILRSVPLPPPDPSGRYRTILDDPPPDRRATGTGEPLTRYARDVLATSWYLADDAAAAAAAEAEAAGEPDDDADRSDGPDPPLGGGP